MAAAPGSGQVEPDERVVGGGGGGGAEDAGNSKFSLRVKYSRSSGLLPPWRP